MDNKITNKELKQEIAYLKDVDREYRFTSYDALKDILSDEYTDTKLDRLVLRQARIIGIKLGIFKHYTDKELESVTVSKGKKYDFIINKKKYLFTHWIY